MYYINSTIVLGISVPKDCGGTSTSTYGFTVRLYLLSGGLCLRPVESEVLSSFSCTLNPHFFRRNFCMLRCTQLYSNPCISRLFWLNHACRSTAAHAAGSGRAARRMSTRRGQEQKRKDAAPGVENSWRLRSFHA